MSFYDLAAVGPPGVGPLPVRELARALLPAAPGAPLVRSRRRAVRWRWVGTILALALPPELDEREYLAILHDAAGPVERATDGRPVYRPDRARLRRGQRALERLALGGSEAHNVACNGGRTVLLNFLGLIGPPTGLNYFTVGTGVGTPSSTDTAMFTEFFRKALTGTTISGNQILETCFFAATDAVGTYTEAGLWGNGATGTAGSGTLFAHAAYNYVKNNVTALSNQYFIDFN